MTAGFTRIDCHKVTALIPDALHLSDIMVRPYSLLMVGLVGRLQILILVIK